MPLERFWARYPLFVAPRLSHRIRLVGLTFWTEQFFERSKVSTQKQPPLKALKLSDAFRRAFVDPTTLSGPTARISAA